MTASTPGDGDERPGSGSARGSAREILRALLPGGEFFRGALTIAGATGAGQLITILAAPIITRLYTPAAYGTFAVAGTLLTLLIAVACLRYEMAVPLPRSDVEAASVVAVCFAVMATISLGLFPALWLFGPAILDWLGARELVDYGWLLPIGVLAGGSLAALGAWMLRTKSYQAIATSRIIQAGTGTGLQIGFGLLGAGAWGLLLGFVAGNVAAVGRLGWIAWRNGADAFRAVSGRAARAAAVRYRRFPIFSSPSIAINIIGLEAPLLWVVATYGLETGGQFALAQRIVALPIAVLASAVGQVFFAEAARLAQNEPAQLAGLFRRTTATLALVAAAPFLLGMIAAPLLFPVIFGDAWSVAGLYAAIIAPSYFLQFVAWPTGGTLDVLERQDLHLVREIVRLLLVGGVVIAASMARLSALEAVIALSVTGSITNVLYAFVSWTAIRRVRHGRAASA